MQGVGFRPFVYRLARELGLDGYVLNDASGVLLEVEGDERAVETFLARLGGEAPPLAVLERVPVREREPTGERGFEIRESPRGESADAPVTPDTATCDDCLRELFDPADRRYRYPFINCTNCGPRFTIVRGVPYDRPLTTMAAFACARAVPGRVRGSRRPPLPRAAECLPALRAVGDAARLRRAAGRRWATAPTRSRPPHARSARADRRGQGDRRLSPGVPRRRRARVAALRARKHREDKPFALMVADARTAARPGRARTRRGDACCARPQRPIVLARRRRRAAAVAPSVAPGTPELGVMLALLAASPPAAARRRGDARDDQRQRLR